VSNKQNEREEPGESGLPAACGIFGSQTVFGVLLEIGDKYFAVSPECSRAEYEGCMSRMVKRRNKVRTSGMSFSETANFPRRRSSNQARDPKIG